MIAKKNTFKILTRFYVGQSHHKKDRNSRIQRAQANANAADNNTATHKFVSFKAVVAKCFRLRASQGLLKARESGRHYALTVNTLVAITIASTLNVVTTQ